MPGGSMEKSKDVSCGSFEAVWAAGCFPCPTEGVESHHGQGAGCGSHSGRDVSCNTAFPETAVPALSPPFHSRAL